MGIEQLVRVIDFVTVPFRLPDRAVKLVYDAFSEWQETRGRDRFTLAQYSGVGIGAGIGAAGIALPFYGYPAAGLYALILGPVSSYASYLNASYLREYAAERGIEKSLGIFNEALLIGFRIFRFPLLSLSAYMFAETIKAKEPFALLPVLSIFAFASYGYLIDGNTSRYEKAKNLARNAFNALYSFLPGRAQQPSPA